MVERERWILRVGMLVIVTEIAILVFPVREESGWVVCEVETRDLFADCGWYREPFQGGCPTRSSDEGFPYVFIMNTTMWYNVFGGKLGSIDVLNCM